MSQPATDISADLRLPATSTRVIDRVAPAHGARVVRSRTAEHVTVERRAFGAALRVACTCLPTRGGTTTLVVRVQATPPRGPRALTARLAARQARRELARTIARARSAVAAA